MAKRKPKTNNELSRKPSFRQMKERILIVCEGDTERIYLRHVINRFKLSETKAIFIAKDNNSSPISVVEYAIEKYENDKKNDSENEYNHIFCVVDRDEHDSFDRAFIKITNQNKKSNNKFQMFFSDPCIEYWLLLHYVYTDKPYTAIGNKKNGGKTKAQSVKLDLKKYVPNYDKTAVDVIKSFLDYLDTALKNAQSSDRAAATRENTNPSTTFYKLINMLINNSSQKI